MLQIFKTSESLPKNIAKCDLQHGKQINWYLLTSLQSLFKKLTAFAIRCSPHA